MAFWLLSGGKLIDRIEWIIDNGFKGVSFLQNAIEIDKEERKEMAAAIVSSQLYVTYHGNVHDNLKESSDIYDSKQTDALLISRDNIDSAWSALE